MYRKISILFVAFVIFISCNNNKNEGLDPKYFSEIAKNDIELQAPQPGEWRYSKKEQKQSFEQFISSKPIFPDSSKNVIYLKPIGVFSNSELKVIQKTREFLEIFFQINVKILPIGTDKNVPQNARRNNVSEQLFAKYILDSLVKISKPKKTLVLMALTEKDLFPKPKWNFVFGLASYNDRVGVSSIYRLKEISVKNQALFLSRLLKISSHEICHMFKLKHCVTSKCLMNGTNSITETDNSPTRLCSKCQQKLNFCLKYDNRKRLNELCVFSDVNNLKSDYNNLIFDKKVLEIQ